MNRRTALKSLLVSLGASWAPGNLIAQSNSSNPRISLGIDVLAQEGFQRIRGKRVGLLTNPAGVNRLGVSSIDLLRRGRGFQLVALFGPEHGIYGNEKANQPIDDQVDPRTGLPVYSLYGKYRKPSPKMLDGLDALIIDLQDLGVRSYTYVSCMKYAMEACFEQGKEVIILDRPNPIGGLKVDGPHLEKEWMSYVGAFQVPYVHGLTIAELAYYAKMTPGVLSVTEKERRRGKLSLVSMKGWQRSMMWPDTGLKWIPTSPAIPDLSAAMGYAMTGLGTQIGKFSHGYGTRYPFRLLQYSGRSPEAIAERLQRANIQGLDYRVLLFQEKGQERRGTYVSVSNWDQLNPTEISFHMMQIACEWDSSNPFAQVTDSQAGLFTKHVGDPAIFEGFRQQGANFQFQSRFPIWRQHQQAFRQQTKRFHLY